MATKLRRDKDLIRNYTENWLKTMSDYSSYITGAYTYITYYQLDDEATKQEETLETVHSLTGKNTPNRYKKINDVIISGIDPLQITTQITERGLTSEISGEFILRPDSIRPYPNDFFVFDTDTIEGAEGLSSHLFRIADVQYDRASVNKQFKCQFELYPDNDALIYDNVENTYQLIYENIGSKKQSVIKLTDSVKADSAKLLVDSLIETYINLFYDPFTNYLVYRKDGVYAWSPYLSHFIVRNSVIKKYSQEILEEFYFLDTNEYTNGEIYKEKSYINSIFKYVETKNIDIPRDASYVAFYDTIPMNTYRNLPFFHSSEAYLFLDSNYESGGPLFNLSAFPILYGDTDTRLIDSDSDHKISYSDATTTEISLPVGDIFYIVSDDDPTDILYSSIIVRKTSTSTVDGVITTTTTTEAARLDFESVLTYDSEDPNGGLLDTDPLILVLKYYFNNVLAINDELLNALNNKYYENSAYNYFIMPIIIYILQDKIKEIYENYTEGNN